MSRFIPQRDLRPTVVHGHREFDLADFKATRPDLLASASDARDGVQLGAARLMARVLDAYGAFYRDGKWLTQPGKRKEFRNNLGCATAAAVLARHATSDWLGRHTRYGQLAIESFDYVIAAHQGSSGAFPVPGDDNYFALSQLPAIYLMMRPLVDPFKADRWRRSIMLAMEAEYTNQATWYTNGNIEIGTCLLWWWAHRISGDDVWLKRRDEQYEFALRPPARWAKFGWRDLPSGGGGYLVEKGDTYGLDWNYTVEQAARCARDYAWTGDVRMLELADKCWRTVRPRWFENEYGWRLNGTGGSRKDMSSLDLGNPVPAILSYLAGRLSVPDSPSMMATIEHSMLRDLESWGLSYRIMGDTIAEIFLAGKGGPRPDGRG